MPSTAIYATAAEIAAQANMTSVNAPRTALLLVLAEVASRAVDQVCNRLDGFVAPATATARVFSGSGRAVQWIDEATSITAVGAKMSPEEAAYTAWTTGEWVGGSGDPRHPNYNAVPYTFLLANPVGGGLQFFPSGRGGTPWPWRSHQDDGGHGAGFPTIEVTAKWAASVACPASVKQASIILASRWYKRGESSWGDVLANVDVGTLQFNPQTDSDVLFLLRQGRFIKPTVGVGP